MSGDRLVQIEVWADVVTNNRRNDHQCGIIARQVCREMVPEMAAEIRRLRGENQALKETFKVTTVYERTEAAV